MKISVIIPAFNAQSYIRRAIDSCFEQSLLPHEIIVADDASTDKTAEIASGFGDPVRVIRLAKNMGVSAARNRAIEESTGDWIAFLDADDWFLPRKLELQCRCIAENPDAVAVYCGIRMQWADASERDTQFVPPDKFGWWLRYACAIHTTSAAMVRRDVFDAVGKFDPAYRNCQDWDMWLRILERYGQSAFAAVPQCLVVYRQVAGSLSSNKLRVFLENIARIIRARCLYGTEGLNRIFLHRRILAFHHFHLATALRENHSDLYLRYMLRSLALWPLPIPREMLPPKRYRFAAVMLAQHLGWWRKPIEQAHCSSIPQV